MGALRPARNGARKQVLSWVGGAHMTGLEIGKTRPKGIHSDGCSSHLVPSPPQLYSHLLSLSLILHHLNTLRITHFILGSEHGHQPASWRRGRAARAEFSCISWAASPATVRGALSSCLGLWIRDERNPLAATVEGCKQWLPLNFYFLFCF